jgi:hypothetical protein
MFYSGVKTDYFGPINTSVHEIKLRDFGMTDLLQLQMRETLHTVDLVVAV